MRCEAWVERRRRESRVWRADGGREESTSLRKAMAEHEGRNEEGKGFLEGSRKSVRGR